MHRNFLSLFIFFSTRQMRFFQTFQECFTAIPLQPVVEIFKFRLTVIHFRSIEHKWKEVFFCGHLEMISRKVELFFLRAVIPWKNDCSKAMSKYGNYAQRFHLFPRKCLKYIFVDNNEAKLKRMKSCMTVRIV